MRIVILSDDYLPKSVKAHSKMLHELAIKLKSHGHDVNILTPGKKSFNFGHSIKIIDGITVIYFNILFSANRSKVSRALFERSLPLMAIKALERSSLDCNFALCINYSPSIFLGKIASYFKTKGSFNYLILRDFFPQWAVDAGILKQYSCITLYFRHFERMNYESADIIGLQSPSNIEIFKKITSNKFKNFEILYNWTNEQASKIDSRYGEKVLEYYGLSKKIILFYGGNVGFAQDMQNIARLARNMRPLLNSHILLVGRGDEFQLLKNLKIDWNLENLTILDAVSQTNYESILSCVDIGLISLSALHSSHNIPGKLLGYIKYGLPILGSVNNENDLIDLVNASHSGFISINGEDDKFVSNAKALVDSHALRKKMGKSSSKLLKKYFSTDNAAKIIMSHVAKKY